MSQVKKLQVGGKFIIDGQEINGNDAVSAVRPYLSWTTGGIMNALREGLTVDYNSADNTVYITDGTEDLTNKYLPAGKKASPSDSNFKKDWDNIWNKEAHRFKQDLYKLKGIGQIPQSIKKPEDENLNLTDLIKGSGWFFDKDEKGKPVYRDTATNQYRLKTIQDIADYAYHFNDYGKEASGKKYNTSKWDPNNLAILQNFFGQYGDPDARTKYMTDLINRIKTNDLKPEDVDVLKLMGFGPEAEPVKSNGGESEGNDTDSIGLGSAPKNWTGDPGSLKANGIYITNNNGRYHANIDPSSKYYGYDTFYLGDVPWIPKGYERGFMIDGDLYTESEVMSDPYLQIRVSPWYSADKSGGYNAYYDQLNNTGIGFVGSRAWNGIDNPENEFYYGPWGTSFNYKLQYNPALYNFFKDKGWDNVNVANMSGWYPNLNGKELYSYLDPTNWQNAIGAPTPSYFTYDPTTGEVADFDLANSGLVRNWYGNNRRINIENLIFDNNKSAYYPFLKVGIEGEQNELLKDLNGNIYLRKVGQNGKEMNPILLDSDLIQDVLKNPNNKWTSKELESFAKKDKNGRRETKAVKAEVKSVPSLFNTENNNNGWANFANTLLDTRTHKNIVLAEKQGGQIPKYFTGGGTGSSLTGINKKDNTNTDLDYTKAHKIGNFTKDEQKEFWAAIGDIASVGLSFANPIAGAVSGAGASFTRYSAEKSRGEEGAGGRLALNLGLDAASLLPILGTGVRAGRAVNAIRKSGKVLMAGLAALGAAPGVLIAADNIINNKEWDSKDVVTVLQGIASLGVLGGITVPHVNKARLAGKRAPALTEEIKLPTARIKTTEGIKDVKLEKSELDAITGGSFGKTELDKKIADILKARTTNRVEVAPSEVKGLAKKFGFDFEKGAKTGKWYSGKREPGKALFDTTPEEPHSGWYYLAHPDQAARVIGQTATPKEVQKAINAGPFGRNWEQRALLRTTAVNPQAFGTMFSNGQRNGFWGTNPLFSRTNFGWDVNYRKPIKVKSVRPKRASSKKTDKPVIEVTVENPVQEAATNGIGYNPTTATPYDPNTTIWDTYGQYGISFKKGGKIVKAQNGTNTSSFIKYSDNGIYQNNPFEPLRWRFWKQESFIPEDRYNEDKSINTGTPKNVGDIISKTYPNLQFNPLDTNRFIYDPGYRYNSKPIGKITGEPINPNDRIGSILNDAGVKPLFAPKTSAIKTKSTETESDGKIQRPTGNGGSWNDWKLNKPNLDDTLDFLEKANAIYKDLDLQTNAYRQLYKRQFQTPQFDRVKHNYSDLEQGFNESLRHLLESKYVTSDSRDSIAFREDNAWQKAILAGQKNAQLTQRFNQTGETNRQIDMQNEANRIQTANEKSAYNTQLDYQLAMLPSVAWNRFHAEALSPFSQQMRQQGRDSWNRKWAYENSLNARAIESSELMRKNYAIRNRFAEEWAALSDADRLKYGDIDMYAYSKDPDWYTLVTAPSEDYKTKSINLYNSYFNKLGSGLVYNNGILSAKSGGTINIKNTNKNQRSVQEQIAINSAKSSKRSVDELSKALLRMLAQLTK